MDSQSIFFDDISKYQAILEKVKLLSTYKTMSQHNASTTSEIIVTNVSESTSYEASPPSTSSSKTRTKGPKVMIRPACQPDSDDPKIIKHTKERKAENKMLRHFCAHPKIRKELDQTSLICRHKELEGGYISHNFLFLNLKKTECASKTCQEVLNEYISNIRGTNTKVKKKLRNFLKVCDDLNLTKVKESYIELAVKTLAEYDDDDNEL